MKSLDKTISELKTSLKENPLPPHLEHPIHIIGAGFSGLMLAIELRNKGFTNIHIIEKRPKELSAIRFQGLTIRDSLPFSEKIGRDTYQTLLDQGAFEDRGALVCVIGSIQKVLVERAISLGIKVDFGIQKTDTDMDLLAKEGTVFYCGGIGKWNDPTNQLTLGNDYTTTMSHVWSLSETTAESLTNPRSSNSAGNWHFRTDRLIKPHENWELFTSFIKFMLSHHRDIRPELCQLFYQDIDLERPTLLLRLLSHNGMGSKEQQTALRKQFFENERLVIDAINDFQILPNIRMNAITPEGIVYTGDALGGPHPSAGLGTRRIMSSNDAIVEYVAEKSRNSPQHQEPLNDLLNLQLYKESAIILAINIILCAFSDPKNWI